jgi:hypothetical protein
MFAIGAVLADALVARIFATPLAFAFQSEINTEQSINRENFGSDASKTSPADETILTALLPAER